MKNLKHRIRLTLFSILAVFLSSTLILFLEAQRNGMTLI